MYIKGKTPVILVLGGSFNPVHTMHIHSFNVVKKHLESLGNEKVVGGFLIPSANSHVQIKLNEDAIELKHRNKMIELAIKSSDWIINYPVGEVNSFKAAYFIAEQLKKKFPTELKDLNYKMICGADFAFRCSLYTHSDVVALGREEYTKELLNCKESFHKDFIFLEHEEMKDISSTLVRKKLKNNEEIGESILDKDVTKYLKKNLKELNKFENKIYF
eukprot:gene5639-9455_t